MSTLVTNVINDCGVRSSDPGFTRTPRTLWLQFLNEAQLEIASELRCIEIDANFDVVGGQEKYTYPPDCVVVRGIAYSDTPSDTTSFKWLNERFEDEWRRETTVHYPQGTIHSYCARQQFIELIGQPSVTVTGGGLITYVRVPAWLTAEASNALEVPDFLRSFLADRMIVFAKRTRNNYAEAAQDEKVWLAKLEQLRDKIEDRSEDRRPAIRPFGLSRPYAGQN